MILGVILGRAQVNPGVAAGTLPRFGFLVPVRPGRGLIPPRLLRITLRLLLGDSPSSEAEGEDGNKNKPTHTWILARCEGKSCWVLFPQKGRPLRGNGAACVGEVLR